MSTLKKLSYFLIFSTENKNIIVTINKMELYSSIIEVKQMNSSNLFISLEYWLINTAKIKQSENRKNRILLYKDGLFYFLDIFS